MRAPTRPEQAVPDLDPLVPEWLTVREAAFLAGLPPEAVLNLALQGRVRCVQLRMRRRRPPLMLVRAADLAGDVGPPVIAPAEPVGPATPRKTPTSSTSGVRLRPSGRRLLAWSGGVAAVLIVYLAFAAYATGFGLGHHRMAPPDRHPFAGAGAPAPSDPAVQPGGGVVDPCTDASTYPSCAQQPAIVAPGSTGSQPDPSTTPAPSAGSSAPVQAAPRVVGSSSGNGDFSAVIATAMAGVNRLLVRVETSPAGGVNGRWAVACTKGSLTGRATGDLSGAAPFTTELRIPLVGADRCTVDATAGPAGGGSVTITFLAG